MRLQNAKSKAAEESVARRLEEVWGCRMVRLAEFDRVDYYKLDANGDRVRGVVEIKNRDVPIAKYNSVFLSLRKWLDLQHLSAYFDCEPLFVVQYTDYLSWVNIHEIGVRQILLKGRYDRGLDNDVEAIIEVPTNRLHVIGKGGS